jgi:hypothetical protein
MEDLLKRIVSAPADTDLLLPNSLKQRSFAATAAYMQLFVTWARHSPEGRLRVYVNEGSEDEEARKVLERALKGDHLMVAAALAGDVRARRGIQDLGSLVKPILGERFSAMDRPETSLEKGGKTFAMCFDDSDFAPPRILYQRRPSSSGEVLKLHSLASFQDLAGSIQSRLNVGVGGGASFAADASLSTALHELFKNTDEWARGDETEKVYPPSTSVRGIRVERRNLDAGLEEGLIEDQPALVDFFAHPSLAPVGGRRRVVEVTVFDSGPGVASRRLLTKHPGRTDFDVGEEFSALRECLHKHVSSSHRDPRGVGLHRVLKDLTELRAFLWLRTGRLSLYRDFVAMPYDPAGDEPYLLDWSAGLGGITELAPAAGSFFTALLPIGHDPNQTTL